VGSAHTRKPLKRLDLNFISASPQKLISVMNLFKDLWRMDNCVIMRVKEIISIGGVFYGFEF